MAKTGTRTSTIPPPLPARARTRSEIDELFSEPILRVPAKAVRKRLLVPAKAPVRNRHDSTPPPGPTISIPLGGGHPEVIEGVSSWAPRSRKHRRLQVTLVASLLVMASAATIALSHGTQRQQETRAQVVVPEPTAVAAERSEISAPAALATVRPVAKSEIEMPAERIPRVERPAAKPAVETPPAAEKPAVEPVVMQSPAAEPAAVEPAPTEIENEAPPVAQLPDAIDRAMILDGMSRMKPAIVRCDQRYGVKGTVNLQIKVGPDGAVASVSVASSPDAALGDCVAAAIRKASFAKTEGGGSFRYPFMF